MFVVCFDWFCGILVLVLVLVLVRIMKLEVSCGIDILEVIKLEKEVV